MENKIQNLKYIYSKLKYNSLKGGRYIQQSNYGQQNCGIFIGYEEHAERLIKCTLPYHEIINIVRENPQIFSNVFPHIYNYYELGSKWYLEMDKLDGDLTNLIFKVFKKESIDETIDESEHSKRVYLEYFLDEFLIPKIKKRDLLQINEMSLYLYKNKDKLIYFFMLLLFNQQNPENKENKYLQLDFDFLDGNVITERFNNGLSYEGVNNYLRLLITNEFYIKNLENINKNISLEILEKFLGTFRKKVVPYIHEILKQINFLQDHLFSNNFIYKDFKLDNFGYKLKDSNKINLSGKEHTIDENFKINGKYIHIYILDIESGLFQTNEYSQKIEINKNFLLNNFSKYGQYPTNLIHQRIPIHDLIINSGLESLNNIIDIIKKDRINLF